MMDVKSGVVTEIKAIQLNTLETHCHADSVSLIVKETTRKSSAASYIRYSWGKKLLNCMAACLHCLISALRRGSYQLM